MTQKEQLIKLILNSPFPKDILQFSKRSAIECDIYCSDIESFADHLLKNGVIVPPCKVGDTVYVIDDGSIYQEKIDFFDLSVYTYNGVYSIEEVFLSREAAENVLKERETKCK